MNKAMQYLRESVRIKSWTLAELGFQGRELQEPLGYLCDDSRAVQPGDTFLCLPRAAAQRERFVQDAIDRGAGAVIVVGEGMDNCSVPLLELRDMAALGCFLRRYLVTENSPVCCMGVTGTDGKTSVAWMLREALARYAGAAWSSGTLGWMQSLSVCHELGNTTPSLLTMHYILAAATQAGIPFWVMEVSSHGIEQERMAGIDVQVAVWTTLGHDHLQDHGGFENYAALKAGFVRQVAINGTVVCNADHMLMQPYLREIAHAAYQASATCSKDATMHWHIPAAGELSLSCMGQHAHIKPVPVGQFHAENLAAVAQVLRVHAGMSLDAIAEVLHEMPAPRGRMQQVDNAQGLAVYVDYAHTPEGLQACLRSARALTEQRLLVVFGCGGNRDVSKRAEMGKVAATEADAVWVTSDNPRDEEPQAIIDDIVSGMSGFDGLRVFVSREDALQDALAEMQHGDVLVVAGKGHEQGIEIQGNITPWDDAAWLQAYFQKERVY